MHVEKNMCSNVVETLFKITKKSKDINKSSNGFAKYDHKKETTFNKEW